MLPIETSESYYDAVRIEKKTMYHWIIFMLQRDKKAEGLVNNNENTSGTRGRPEGGEGTETAMAEGEVAVCAAQKNPNGPSNIKPVSSEDQAGRRVRGTAGLQIVADSHGGRPDRYEEPVDDNRH